MALLGSDMDHLCTELVYADELLVLRSVARAALALLGHVEGLPGTLDGVTSALCCPEWAGLRDALDKLDKEE